MVFVIDDELVLESEVRLLLQTFVNSLIFLNINKFRCLNIFISLRRFVMNLFSLFPIFVFKSLCGKAAVNTRVLSFVFKLRSNLTFSIYLCWIEAIAAPIHFGGKHCILMLFHNSKAFFNEPLQFTVKLFDRIIALVYCRAPHFLYFDYFVNGVAKLVWLPKWLENIEIKIGT